MPKEQFVSFIRYCHYLFVRNIILNLCGNTYQTNCDLFRFRTVRSMTGSIVSKLTWIKFLGLDHLNSLGTLGNEELQCCAAVNGFISQNGPQHGLYTSHAFGLCENWPIGKMLQSIGLHTNNLIDCNGTRWCFGSSASHRGIVTYRLSATSL